LRNYPECGKVFVYIAKRICPECREAEEKDFRTLGKYLSEHRGAGLNEVHSATGVAVERILRFLREGRLVETGAQWKVLKCESCGADIGSGKYCSKCAQDLSKELQNAVRDQRKDEPVERGKIYIMDRLNKR